MMSNIVRDVPSRARGIEQISEFVEKHGITNEMLIKIGLRMNGNLLFGSNQRCVAMLIVFKSIMDDIKSIKYDSNKPLILLQNRLNEALDFLDFCRPLSVSMTNASKLVKGEILKLEQSHTDQAIARLRLARHPNSPSSLGSSDDTQQQQPQPSRFETRAASISSLSEEWQAYETQKEELKKFIDRFIDEEIWSAQRGICENIYTNIANGDVILVYGCSTIVQHVLLHAKTRGKKFKVIVVDSPPHFNGRRMIRFLNDSSIDVAYTLINSLSFVIRMSTKVLLGANSMLANGYVMSHIGTSQVALMAKASNVPTLVCCETYKLSDRVYVDSFGCNEVDSALNLRYDLTPPEFVSMVINERNTVPPNSVPALLRFRAERILYINPLSWSW